MSDKPPAGWMGDRPGQAFADRLERGYLERQRARITERELKRELEDTRRQAAAYANEALRYVERLRRALEAHDAVDHLPGDRRRECAVCVALEGLEAT